MDKPFQKFNDGGGDLMMLAILHHIDTCHYEVLEFITTLVHTRLPVEKCE